MKKRKYLRWVLLVLLFLAVPGCIVLWAWNLGRVHQHCMKISGMTLRRYASDHEGRFPTHTNGFGDALALLIMENPYDAQFFVGVGDNADWLRAAATNHTHVPEDICTRIYVQGLTETNNPEIAILFDKYAVRGGDHFRSRSEPYLREVCLLDGFMKTVTLDRWPAFASNQVELLVQEGISRKTAEAYYRPTLDPNAKR